ncbi:MAG TPA: AAA family ATPase [Kiritimatiellia bacterium]|nr:AAA family ATPase [Kiritimatiellia bacterium]HMP00712.1 AAA family ATPase [Kiritimatiellia bacterium]
MRIETFAYTDKARNWHLEPVTFSKVTLLVGVSGVGKTQILKALLNIKHIAEGKSRNGIEWDLSFVAKNGKKYRWQGAFESRPGLIDETFEVEEEDEAKPRERPGILLEQLFCDGSLIVKRDRDKIELNGTITPKLSPSTSALSLFSQEDFVKPASESFQRILYSNQTSLGRGIPYIPVNRLDKVAEKYNTLEKIQECAVETHLKLAVVSKYHQEYFKLIKERFCTIFPQVVDMRLETKADESLPFFLGATPIIQIKEKGVDDWIDQTRISSGMLRSIYHIAEMYLWPEGTVILIDEFENSLGVNCIDVLTEDLLTPYRDLQFIVTSHHPYIINNIGYKYWKIVSRRGGTVKVSDVGEAGLGASSHEAFIKLINSDLYRDGIVNA